MGTICSLENLVSGRATKNHIAQLKPFKFNPKYTTPLNVAVKDTEEYVVEDIIDHQKTPDGTMRWLVRWNGYLPDDDTWEPYEHLKDVDKFQDYCRRHTELSKYLPRQERRVRKRTNR